MPKEFLKEPKAMTKVAYNPKDFMTDEQIKKMEEDQENDTGADILAIETDEVPKQTTDE